MAARNQNGRSIRAAVEDGRKVMEMNFNYEKTFGDKHKLNALAGYSWEENNNNDGFQLTTSDYYDDGLGYYNPGMANVVDLLGFGNYYLSTLRMISFYGRLNYTYNSKYIFQATVRRDGSSAFGENNRWATFPSISAAWRLSEESFIQDLGVFNDLKLRAGYGVSGNSLGFDVFTARRVYGATSSFYTDANGRDLRTLAALRNANPDLRWERTGMLNLGLDFAILDNRLSGTLEYYTKNTTDLIYDYAVSTTKYLYSS
ncbi:TonB-dependent receptor, partial [Brucella sp. 21LCYQ03]|nr:TonB-dependent receptor [Brucella sp. 21LCYQ03]